MLRSTVIRYKWARFRLYGKTNLGVIMCDWTEERKLWSAEGAFYRQCYQEGEPA